MRTFHAGWFYVAVISAGLVGMWGLVFAIRRMEPIRAFFMATYVAIGAVLVQVGSGLILWGRGERPGDGFHVFYGVVIVTTFAFAYIYRPQLGRRPALGYGLLMLFVMGLGIRAWTTVA